MDVKYLIAQRALIHSAAKSLAKKPSIEPFTSKRFEAVSLVSERPLHWQFVVAASGFMESRRETGIITIPKVIRIVRAEPVKARAYFDVVTTLPTEQVLLAGPEAMNSSFV